MTGAKSVLYHILERGSLKYLEGMLSSPRKQGGRVLFLVDEFFQRRGIESKLPLESGDKLIFISTNQEPHADYINELAERLREDPLPCAVVGMGGGTAMDIAKCISILLSNPGSVENYQGWELVQNPAVYKIAVPTLSGTGAESSRTAVLTSKKAKLGINSDYSVFDCAILDPDLLETVPKEQFVFTAMDCYLHDIELLKNLKGHEMARALAEKSLELIKEVMLGNAPREKLMVASYFGGLAQRDVYLHICHPLSYGLSFVLGLRHGIANCVAFNQLDEYFLQEVREFRTILHKWDVTLPEGILKNIAKEQLDIMAEATLKNERPLEKAFGTDWRLIFTRDKIKSILRNM